MNGVFTHSVGRNDKAAAARLQILTLRIAMTDVSHPPQPGYGRCTQRPQESSYPPSKSCFEQRYTATAVLEATLEELRFPLIVQLDKDLSLRSR
jgi:hypothetical protein